MSSLNENVFGQLWLLLPLALIVFASCVGEKQGDTKAPSSRADMTAPSGRTVTTARSGVVIVSTVKSVSPLASRETASRKRWRVELEVTQIVAGSAAVKIGDNVTVWVHSVVKTFGEDTSAIVGKSYRVTFDDVFAKDYYGEIAVASVPKNRGAERDE